MFSMIVEKLEMPMSLAKDAFRMVSGRGQSDTDVHYDYASPERAARESVQKTPYAYNTLERDDHDMLARVRAALYADKDA